MKMKINSGGPKRLDLVGQRFGMLMVIEKMPSDKIMTKFKCKCDCGNEKIIIGSELKRGNWKSCGCNRTPRTTHEYRNHPLYDVWKGMKARCRDERHISRRNYLDKGVTVCQEWKDDFMAFYNWSIQNGWDDGLQLDKDIKSKRLGITPIYSPESCTWVTPAENSQNRVGLKLSWEFVSEIRNSNLRRCDISKKYNINPTTVDRIKQNKIWKQ